MKLKYENKNLKLMDRLGLRTKTDAGFALCRDLSRDRTMLSY